MLTREIKIYVVFGANLKTREMAKKLFELALFDNYSTLIFDFENVQFISRSFAHEFISLKDEQNALCKVVVLENKCAEVVKMFEAVINSLLHVRKHPVEAKVSTFESFDALSQFLSTI